MSVTACGTWEVDGRSEAVQVCVGVWIDGKGVDGVEEVVWFFFVKDTATTEIYTE